MRKEEEKRRGIKASREHVEGRGEGECGKKEQRGRGEEREARVREERRE